MGLKCTPANSLTAFTRLSRMDIDSLPGQNPALGHDVYKEGTITMVLYKFFCEGKTKLAHQ